MTTNIPRKSKLTKWPEPRELQIMIDYKAEEEGVIFRFNDLSEKGKAKLCNLLKRWSPVWSIRKQDSDGGITRDEIYHALRIANPPIFRNYYRQFSGGQLNRGVATEISRVVYRLCRNTPTTEKIESLKRSVSTQRNQRHFGPSTSTFPSGESITTLSETTLEEFANRIRDMHEERIGFVLPFHSTRNIVVDEGINEETLRAIRSAHEQIVYENRLRAMPPENLQQERPNFWGPEFSPLPFHPHIDAT